LVQGAGQALQAAIEDELGEERLVQAPLFPAQELDRLPAEPFARREQLRRPGRPIGSPNKRSLRMREFIALKGYTDPLLFFAEAISRNVGDLAKELGCSPLEAFQEMRHCASELAPYLHSKMPVAVLHAGVLPSIELVDPAAAALMFAESGNEQIQSLIDVSDAPVSQPELHSAENEQADQGVDQAEHVIADHGDGGRP
jgi:hypothetical protein